MTGSITHFLILCWFDAPTSNRVLSIDYYYNNLLNNNINLIWLLYINFILWMTGSITHFLILCWFDAPTSSEHYNNVSSVLIKDVFI